MVELRVLFVYKRNISDPTLRAFMRWFPRFRPDINYFEFTFKERGKTESVEPNARFIHCLKKSRPSHIFVWGNLLNVQEIELSKNSGAVLSVILDNFASLFSGCISDQKIFFEGLRKLDWYFITHAPDVSLLRGQGVNAHELPFFYDPDYYRPLPAWKRLYDYKMIDILFIGAVSEPAAATRKEIICALAKHFKVHVITGINPRVKNIIWHPPEFHPHLLNWWINRSRLILNIEDVGHCYYPEAIKKTIQNSFVDYKTTHVFHGNHIFPAMGAGTCCVSEFSTELEKFFIFNKEIVVWRDVGEAIERIHQLLAHKDERKAIAQSGHKKAAALHTAAIRIKQMLSIMGETN